MYIYKITNTINGMSYIGLKTKSVEESKDYYGSGKLIQRAIKKHGKENFIKEILEDGIKDFKYLCERERYYINLHNTKNNGYNITEGGLGSLGRLTSKETKLILAEKQRGRIKTQEEINKLSKSHSMAMIGKPLPISDLPCPHCGKIMAKSHMTRWHGDKCKMK